jgi:hypothetical protein
MPLFLQGVALERGALTSALARQPGHCSGAHRREGKRPLPQFVYMGRTGLMIDAHVGFRPSAGGQHFWLDSNSSRCLE